MVSEGSRRRLAAIMFADMVGYTALMQEDEDEARIRRDRFRDALGHTVVQHHGEVLQHYGDGALCIFDSAVEAVEAAVALQRELRRDPEVPLRIGVHAGDIVYGEDGVLGDGVNVASRIESLSVPGGIMVSDKVYDEIKNHSSLSAESRGEVRLKHLKHPQRVFAITNEGLAVPSVEVVRSKAWETPPERSTSVAVRPAESASGEAPVGVGEGLLRRIRERSLIQWGFAYLAGAWAFLEAAGFAEGAFQWQPSVSRVLVLAVVLGLPLTLVVAWYHGERGRQRVSGTELLLLALLLTAGGALMAALGPEREGARSGAPPLPQAAGLAELPSIAVLPFVNQSGTPDTEPFATGIHDDVLTQLSKIGGLRVISRTSVLSYRNTAKSIPQIAQELGVAVVLEGGVQRAGNRIRMNAQLIDAGTDAHLWAERYDTIYTVENVFAIQSAIATSIADALEAVLTPAERAEIGEVPTGNREAYDAYLSGIENLTHPGWTITELTAAQEDFEAAVAMDPDFALAHAHLSVVHFLFFRVSYDASPARLELAREAAQRALEVDPELPQGHLALSQYYYVAGQQDRALAELAIAGQGLPNDPWVPVGLAMVRQRQGAWDQAVAHLERAADLDPRNPEFSFLLGDTYLKMRRWRDAERQMDRTLTLAPGLDHARVSLALIRLLRDGETEPLLSLLAGIPSGAELGGHPAFFMWWGRFLSRDFAGSEAALDSVGPRPTGWPMPYTPSLLRGLSRWHDGRVESARTLIQAHLPSLETDVSEGPDQAGPHQALGLAYAILGRRDDAVREGLRATALLPVARDAYDGPLTLTDLARIYAMVGEQELAIDQLEVLLSIPGDLTVPLIATDPMWDPLRDSPRFQELLRD